MPACMSLAKRLVPSPPSSASGQITVGGSCAHDCDESRGDEEKRRPAMRTNGTSCQTTCDSAIAPIYANKLVRRGGREKIRHQLLVPLGRNSSSSSNTLASAHTPPAGAARYNRRRKKRNNLRNSRQRKSTKPQSIYLILIPDQDELLAAPDDRHKSSRLGGLSRLVDHNRRESDRAKPAVGHTRQNADRFGAESDRAACGENANKAGLEKDWNIHGRGAAWGTSLWMGMPAVTGPSPPGKPGLFL